MDEVGFEDDAYIFETYTTEDERNQKTETRIWVSERNPDLNECLIEILGDEHEDIEDLKKELSSSCELHQIKVVHPSDILTTRALLPRKYETRLIKEFQKNVPEACDLWDAYTGQFECNDVKSGYVARFIPQIYLLGERLGQERYSLVRPSSESEYGQINDLILAKACDKVQPLSFIRSAGNEDKFFEDACYAASENQRYWMSLFKESGISVNANAGVLVLPLIVYLDFYKVGAKVRTAEPISYRFCGSFEESVYQDRNHPSESIRPRADVKYETTDEEFLEGWL